MDSPLTFEEKQVLALCNSDYSRSELISELREVRIYLETEDSEMLKLLDSALAKLDAMTDADYTALDLYPDFDPEDADGE